MKYKWIKTKFLGVRYREHPTRKHGVRKDRYYTIRYKLNGKDKEEALGWESEGWTEKKVSARLSELKESHRTGVGEKTLADRRRIVREKEIHEKEAKAKVQKDLMTFCSVFMLYIEQSFRDKKPKTCKTEKIWFNKWLVPLLGHLPMKDVSPFILEKLKKQMTEAGRAPRTVAYILAIVRQVFNYAKIHDLYSGDNPASKVKKPSEDNRRTRFLSQEEAELLLGKLKETNTVLHDIALISLHCGLRAGEIFNLTWHDIEFRDGIVLIKDTKSGRNRNAIMTANVKEMLESRKKETISGLVFKTPEGRGITEASHTFKRTFDALGFNNGIKDRRQKVVFHTLRHTYASWLVMSGVDLYTVQRLMGHSTMAMTERYSHLAPNHLKKAVNMLENSINQHKESNIINFKDIAK